MPKKRPMMGVRRFRDAFPSLTESVTVIRATKNIEVLGTWIPEKREKETQEAQKRPE